MILPLIVIDFSAIIANFDETVAYFEDCNVTQVLYKVMRDACQSLSTFHADCVTHGIMLANKIVICCQCFRIIIRMSFLK